MKGRTLLVAGLVAGGSACGHGPGQATSNGSAGMSTAGDDASGSDSGGQTDAGGKGAAGEAASGQAGAELAGGGDGQGACDPGIMFEPSQAPRVRGLELHQLAVFQAVKVPIMEQGLEVSPRKTSLVSARPALLRAYVKPGDDWQPRVVRGRLTLTYPQAQGEPQVFDQTRMVEVASTDALLASTFNFEISAKLMTEKVAYSVELFETQPCVSADGDSATARFPAALEQTLGAEPASTIRVQVVPVVYDTGNDKLTPDTSPAQLDRLRANILRLFPISKLELSVRPQPLTTSAGTMVEVLDLVAALRDEENPPPDLAYYGLVRFTETREQYCGASCVLGASFNGELPSVGVGVGVGYSGDVAAYTMAHELGHVYGRPHTACGVSGDPAYPYSGGRTGSWGYDVQAKQLFDPFVYSDLMGYCSPVWVSDYTFEHVHEFIAAVEAAPKLRVEQAAEASFEPQGYRSLLLEPGKAPSWGAPRKLRATTAGRPELARVFDATGHRGADAHVFRRVVADTSAEIVYVPEWVYQGQAILSLQAERIVLPAKRDP